MAIYHCSVQVIGRNAGRSCVAASAYRAAENLTNEYDGVQHDFTKKNWVEFTEIILPYQAPKEYADRSTLWNAVELAEKAKDAQLCREFELALPIEMTREQQIRVVERFAKDQLVAQGMIVDIAIHNPPVTNDRHQPIDQTGNVTKDVSEMQFINPHAHILATVRPIDENGKWQKKSEIEYICIQNGKEKAFTATEFQTAKENGWEKQYKFLDGKKKIWLTAEAGNLRELKRVNRSPKTSAYGRKNKIVEYWNSKDRIFEWRQYWEKVVNDEFARNKSEIRIDSRSFKDQGREDELPTRHMGTSAVNMEKRAERELREGAPESFVERSDIGNINRQIKEHNQFVKELKVKMEMLVEKAKNAKVKIARKLEGIRAKLIGNTYEEVTLTTELSAMESEAVLEDERLIKYSMESDRVDKANIETVKEIKKLQKDLEGCSVLQFMKKNDLQKQIQELQEQIEDREEYVNSIARMCGYATKKDYQMAKEKQTVRKMEQDKLKKTVDALQTDTNVLIDEYKNKIEEIPKMEIQDIEEKRMLERSNMEQIVRKKLQEGYGRALTEEKYAEARQIVDNRLKLDKSGKPMQVMEATKPKQNIARLEKEQIREKSNPRKKSIRY